MIFFLHRLFVFHAKEFADGRTYGAPVGGEDSLLGNGKKRKQKHDSDVDGDDSGSESGEQCGDLRLSALEKAKQVQEENQLKKLSADRQAIVSMAASAKKVFFFFFSSCRVTRVNPVNW